MSASTISLTSCSKVYSGFQPSWFFGFGGVADEHMFLGGAIKLGIDHNVVFVVEVGVSKGLFAELANGVSLARSDNVIVRFLLLQHRVHGPDVIFGVTPVALGVEVTEFQFGLQAKFDAGDSAGDLASHKLETSSGTFVVEQDPRAAVHVVFFTIVSRQVETGDFADPVSTAWVETGLFGLGCFGGAAEHFATAGEIELAMWLEFSQCGQEVMRTADVGGHSRDPVGKAFCDKALGGQVITFVERMLAKDMEEAGIAFQVGAVKRDLVEDIADPGEATFGVFDGDPADQAVDFVALVEQVFSEVAAVLAGDTCDECFFGHAVFIAAKNLATKDTVATLARAWTAVENR